MGATFRPTSPAYLARIEALIGLPLPAEFVDFLARFGACALADEMAIRLPDGGWAEVQAFLGNDPDDSYDITANLAAVACPCEDEVAVPFARDALGNLFCLRLARPPGGSGAAAYHLDLADDRWQPVAASFAEFLARLVRPAGGGPPSG